MDSTDSHWLQVKQDWLPIEALLSDLAPYVQSAKDQIDCLVGQVDAQTIRDLHFLRIHRNKLLHEGQAIKDLQRWMSAAKSARTQLETLQARKKAARRAQAAQSGSGVAPAGTDASASENEGTSTALYLLRAATRLILKLAVWGVGSWYLRLGSLQALAWVNEYSAAWWGLHVIGVLCWPGIAVGFAVMGIGTVLWWMVSGVFTGFAWLVEYIIAHPY